MEHPDWLRIQPTRHSESALLGEQFRYHNLAEIRLYEGQVSCDPHWRCVYPNNYPCIYIFTIYKILNMKCT